MRVAIIGAARNRNGIGEYIAKYLHASGAEVKGVLGSTGKSALAAAASLVKYGIRAGAYTDFAEMINESNPDCVVIASPSHTHKKYIEQCVDAGVHVLCEKPFISPDVTDADGWIEDIFARAKDKGITIAMNSQWPFSLPFYEELCGKIDPAMIKQFSIRLSPLSVGHEKIADSVPHALSLLYCAAGSGRIGGITFDASGDSMQIRFIYYGEQSRCDTVIDLVQEITQPRTFTFGFNGRVVARHIKGGDYTIHLTYGDKILQISDPLELSVRDFLAAASSGSEPLMGSRHIRLTALMLRQIYTEYMGT